jgi:hypothetical protein
MTAPAGRGSISAYRFWNRDRQGADRRRRNRRDRPRVKVGQARPLQAAFLINRLPLRQCFDHTLQVLPIQIVRSLRQRDLRVFQRFLVVA